jgi:hydrogenase-4 component B
MIAFLAFLALCLGGGVLSLLVRERDAARVTMVFGMLAGLALIVSAAQTLAGEVWHLPLWRLPALGQLTLGADRLSGWFLLITGLVAVPVFLFSARYLQHYAAHYRTAGAASISLFLLASIGLTLATRDVFGFIFAWEIMSGLCYLAVNFEHLHDATPKAALMMLVASEAGALLQLLALLLLATHAGSTQFGAIAASAASIAPGMAWAIFLLSFFGFGVKAGLFPSMGWLPRAHPVAPAPASALLSGVIVNLGIYGIVRVNTDLLPISMPAAGVIVLLVGALGAIIGILYATIETEFKRLLAHSTIENMGLVAMGIGAALIFRSLNQPVFAAMALIAALLHLLNHSIAKSLLFLSAGAVDITTGTRDLNALGGLIRKLPWLAGACLIGCMMLAALPPTGGFASEWLLIQSLLRSAELAPVAVKLAFVLAGALMALTAGLALATFTRLFALAFLGMPRTPAAQHPKPLPASMRWALAVLAAGCIVLGVLPTYIVAGLGRVVGTLGLHGGGAALVPPFYAPGNTLPAGFVTSFHALGAQLGSSVLPPPGLVLMHRGGTASPVVFAAAPAYLDIALLLGLLILWLVVRAFTSARKLTRRRAWDGGLPELQPQLTYTATGFGNAARVIFSQVLAPNAAQVEEQTVARHFRASIKRTEHQPYVLDRWLFGPLMGCARGIAEAFAAMHHGRLNGYVAYALGALLLALAVGFWI